MKNIYIFFVFLTYLTVNSFALRAETVEITAVFSNNTYNSTTEPSIIDGVSKVFAGNSITSEVATITAFDNNQITSITKTSSSQAVFIAPSINEQLLNSKANNDNRLKIRLELFTSGHYKREILLTIDSRSTDAMDKGFDAILNTDNPNDMYWMLNDDKLVIQAINELKKDRVVPIGIKSMGDCSMQIQVSTIDNPYPGMEIYLRDNDTMDTYDIINEFFKVTLEEGQFNDKYSIVFVPKAEIETTPVVAVSEPEIEEMQNEIENSEVINELHVFVGSNNEVLRIKKPEEMTLTSIAMFNLIGQQINVWNANLNLNDIDLPIHTNKGVHLILMDTNKGRLMKKVLIK